MFSKVLIANRGAIACRVIRSLRAMNIRSVAVYSEADRHSLHVSQADEAVCIGPAAATESYLNAERILEVARETGAQAIHPGYGFLSENDSFAERCEAAGIAFIGPTAEQMRTFGLKHTARQLAEDSGVPLLPGSGLLESLDETLSLAKQIGYPVMLKSTAGGGGIGMQLCENETTLREAYVSVRRLSQNNFANAGIFLEKFVQRARHVEVQIVGDGQGEVVALGERDCSLQRRNQKVVEETPAPNLPADTRSAMLQTAEQLGRAISYRSAGTVEYIYDADNDAFYFLEVNTRLQVEHGVTEEVTGLDLVEWMIRIAAGDGLPLDEAARKRMTRGEEAVPLTGHSIQVRLYAEDPARDFRPSTGVLTELDWGNDRNRIETWVERGTEVSPWYDPMLAKLIVHAQSREAAISKLGELLQHTRIAGLETNLDYLRQVLVNKAFVKAGHDTGTLNRFDYRNSSIEVLSAGTQTSIQDWPGRVSYWDIGVPPSGPMDSLAFRLGNRLLGNSDQAAGLEITVTGPRLKFFADTVIALCGAPMQAQLDDTPLAMWQAVTVRRGQILKLGKLTGAGARAYLLFAGGLDAPLYLGSRATFTLGQFGGHGGRTLRAGDVLHLEQDVADAVTPAALAASAIPEYGNHWRIHVVYGPHGAPDFFTPGDIQTFFATHWQVHYNSSRTGVRLIGPKPEWARRDGGEAGLHPSNIHDNAYAIGSVDFTGDMPVILGPDGPSLGGFVCPVTVISAELWKLGQLRAGDSVEFIPVSVETARTMADAQEHSIHTLQDTTAPVQAESVDTIIEQTPVLLRKNTDTALGIDVSYRPAGDCYLLVEYGEMTLDLALRFRVQALLESLREQAIPGIIDLTPGVRSLQVHYDPAKLPLTALMERLQATEKQLRDLSKAKIPSRIVHLPLAWDDSQTQLAISKYQQSVRADAPWCPNNIEFIRRINGMEDETAVKRIVYDASYLVMGLGDVYLSAPLTTPVDPRHRLVTTKYNPARTWTPENAVGIGGSYMCIYGMEGPGGYQFVGRTLQVWNRYHSTPQFEEPWLLRFFDQIRFYEVSEDELLQMREDFPRGHCGIKIEETHFSLAEYQQLLEDNAEDIKEFKTRQQAAFEEERQRWADAGNTVGEAEESALPESDEPELVLDDDEAAVEAHVQGLVWQLAVKEGEEVAEGQTLLVLEFMKTEVPVVAEYAGHVGKVLCSEGAEVIPGQPLLVLRSKAALEAS